MLNYFLLFSANQQAASNGKNAKGGAGGMILPIILIVVLVAVMIIFQIINGKKRKKQAQEFSQKLKAGSKIMTTSGFIGEIIGFDDVAGTVILNIARSKDEKFEITVAKAAISRIIPEESPAAKVNDSKLSETSKEDEEKKAAIPTTEDEVEAEKKAKEKAEKKAKEKAEKKEKLEKKVKNKNKDQNKDQTNN